MKGKTISSGTMEGLRNALAVVTVILVVLVLAWLILSMDAPSGDRAEPEPNETRAGHEEGKEGDRGFHGRRLAQDGFEIEIGLSEAEGASRFQAVAYEGKKPVDPEAVQLSLDLQRPGKEPETLYFQVEGDYLRSREVIAEPHVFAVKAAAQYEGKTYHWEYWQVEGGIELPSGAVEEAGIEVKPAGPAALKTVLALPGEIQLNPRRVAHVVPRVEGVVVEVRKELGDPVKQ
ncbi:MAG: efflux RND transporter periplasmic adaptor subunit, partial [Gammaproteobacteria bacterium]